MEIDIMICPSSPVGPLELGSGITYSSAGLGWSAHLAHRETAPRVATSFLDPTKEKLWDSRSSRKGSVCHPLSWNDDKQPGKSSCSHDFQRRVLQEVVNSRLADLDVKKGDRDPRRPVEYDVGVTAETVNQLCKQGQLTEAVEALGVLVQTGTRTSQSLFYAVLKKCVLHRDLTLGRHVHALIIKAGYESDTFLCNHVLRMYASQARLQDAMDVFAVVAEPDAFMWSAIISAHVKHRQVHQAIQLYQRMRMTSVKPDGHVFVAALQACARAADLKSGQQVHADVLASGIEPDLFVCSCLVDMYARCGSFEDAERVFDGLPRKDVVVWNTMLAGYSQKGMGDEALRLYRVMQDEGVIALDPVTFVCLLQACASVGTSALEEGKQLHAQIRDLGLQADVFVANSLVNMYAKCGSLDDARNVFDGLSEKNVVTWTALIAGYSQQGMGQEALHLYGAMREEGIVAPNYVTFVCLLQACANVAALDVGRQLHSQIKDQGFLADATVGNSLINMYSKSGSMFDAQHVFDVLPKRDVVTWSALIAGYTRQGDSDKVFDLVLRMREGGIQPDGITFLSLLTVCSHTGLVNEGQEYFDAMSKEYGITPTVQHYACMVDLFGRAGRLDESLTLVRTMPVLPDAAVWLTLLGACRKWRNVEMGLLAFNEAVKLDKKDAAAYVLMSNIYIGAQMWEQAQEMQERRTGIGAWKKQPGQSWWTDIDGRVHTFLVGDKEHPETEAIYSRLNHLLSNMKQEGYVPHLDSLLADMTDDMG